jgi:uncharacterized protein YbaR (Trm112 family)
VALSADLLEILRCPENRTVLKLADADLLGKLNAAVEAGTLKSKGDQVVKDKLDAGLVREDEAIVYAVRDDIPVMLVEEGIPLAQLG